MTNLHDCGTHSPSRCSVNDRVDDTRLSLRIVRVHVGRLEGDIAGIHDEAKVDL